MKLYMHPGACSLSPHIVCRELDLPVELVAIDRTTHRTGAGGQGHGEKSGETYERTQTITHSNLLDCADATR